MVNESQRPDCTVSMPGTKVLGQLLAELDDTGIVAAVGGSGLLAALGLIHQVRDWDVTTDEDLNVVKSALTAAGIPYTPQPSGDGRFASRARLLVDGGDHDIDLIVGFALRAGQDIIHFPTRVTGQWLGLPMADPHIWAQIYRHLGRDAHATTLDHWIAAQP